MEITLLLSMSQRTTETKRLNPQPNTVLRDKQYYFNTLDIEHDMLKKAADIAERMMTAFMRENKVEVTVNVDDIADKIIAKILDKMPTQVIIRDGVEEPNKFKEDFNLDDGPVVIKTERVEIKGKVGSVSKSTDNINESLDVLEGLKI